MAWFKKSESLTGDRTDDKLFMTIASRSDIGEPRHWVQYFYCADETAANTAAGYIRAAGWSIQRLDRAATGTNWVVIAEKHDVILTPEGIRSSREFFKQLAAGTPGGEYDGWEASI